MHQHFPGLIESLVFTFCGTSSVIKLCWPMNQGPALLQALKMSNITCKRHDSLSPIFQTYLSILVTPAPPSLGHLHTSKSIVPFPNNSDPHQVEDLGIS